MMEIITYSTVRNLKKLLFFIVLFAFSSVALGNVQCTSGKMISDQPIYYYGHFLGIYTVNLSLTLSAIKSGSASTRAPFYKRKWRNPCPSGFHETQPCVEFTIYPSDQNFSPKGIMEKIEQYTGGVPSRSGARVITNATATQYVYTLDHEITFCGPYSL